MKALYWILLILLLSKYNSEKCTGLTDDKKSCKGRELEGDEYRCCFAKYKVAGTEIKGCSPVTKDEYEKIDDTLKKLEDDYDFKDVSFDCSSNFIVISLLSLIILLS